MAKQLQWVIGGLTLLIVGFVALQIYLSVDKQRFKEKHSSPDPKTETETDQPPEPNSLTAPEGYYYVSDGETENYYLDESGQPILTKKGEPFTTIDTYVGFAPTREVYNHYLELSTEYEEAKKSSNSLRASELKAEMDQIEKDSQGEVPVICSVIVFEAGVTQEERELAIKRVDPIWDTKLRQALIDMHLTHLF